MVIFLTLILSVLGGVFFKVWEPSLASLITHRFQYNPIILNSALNGSSIINIITFILGMYGISNLVIGGINDDGDLVIKGFKVIIISILSITFFRVFFMEFFINF